MKYLKHFATIAEYNVYKNSNDFITPNVSDTEEDPTFVRFTPFNSTPIMPELIGAKVLCKYNVSDTDNPVTLYYQSGGSGSGSGSGDTSMFSSMEVDGVEQSEVTNEYTFDTEGEHTVLFTLPEGVTSIDDYAFQYCQSLTSITIPDSVTLIGNDAFGGCSGLTSISVDANNQTYDSRNNCNAIIETSTNTLILGCKNTIIPDSVTSIDSNAFNGCSSLTSITIPDSVTSIDYGAFNGCSGLTSVTIPDSVTSIGEHAFHDCSGLTSVTIGNSVTSIGNSAFYNCYGLTSVTIGNSVTSIGNSAFEYCSKLTSITIPDSVTSIDNYVFEYCYGLTSITCNAITAPTIQSDTFMSIKTNGTLTVPAGSTGYNVWMRTDNFYLGSYNWTKVEQ